MKEHPRILIVSCGIFSLFSLLIVQFFRVQVIQENKWKRFAKAQHEIVIKEPFKRGVFYSNMDLLTASQGKKQPFVIDIPMFHLFADPFQLSASNHSEVARKIQEILNLPEEDQAFFKTQFDLEKSRSRKLKMWLTQPQKNELHDWWFTYARRNKIANNALYFISDYKRSYPFNTLLGQFLHTIQENKDEQTHQGIPTGGAEYYFNSILEGVEGKTKLQRSPKHPLDLGKIIQAPINGADVYLTINHHLQAIAEEEIEKGVKNVEAKSGWAIIMDPYTGEILAFAQYPFFSPADYKSYYNCEENIELTRLKGVCDSYEPGSVTKAITMAICFLANEELAKQGKKPVLDVDEKVYTKSGKFPGRTRDLKDPRPHSYLNFYQAMQKSSNIYPARIIERVINELGADWYREQLVTTFGLGEKTGIEYPLEAQGLIPSPKRKHANGTLEWSTPTPYSLAMGHNFMVNSLQMLRAFATFANGGYLIRPTFVRKIVKEGPQGKEVVLVNNTQKERKESFPRILQPYMVEEIVKALKYSMRYGGSGNLGDVYGYSVAGKSGTSNKIVDGEYSKKSYFSSFIGFAPVDNPRFILLVSMDEPKAEFKHGIGYMYYGGKCAAPVFRELARRTLQFLGVPPDNPFHYPLGDPRYNPEKAHWHKEAKELNELYKKWNLKK
ncbi:MAG: putative peptidoglycan D,D-transpeptidase PenA [Chlamydiae bacterium]|nr:putative peptidoglycan D,D-transpeptidase PenA [Chlamydiota bacterium]